jgi:hypothetical protein
VFHCGHRLHPIKPIWSKKECVNINIKFSSRVYKPWKQPPPPPPHLYLLFLECINTIRSIPLARPSYDRTRQVNRYGASPPPVSYNFDETSPASRYTLNIDPEVSLCVCLFSSLINEINSFSCFLHLFSHTTTTKTYAFIPIITHNVLFYVCFIIRLHV